MPNLIKIQNRRIFYEYEIEEKYVAGIELLGTEIKSIRQGKVSLSDAWCFFKDGELFVKGMQIAEYELGTHNNHEPLRIRKLLLKRTELNKLDRKVKERGFTIVVIKLFVNNLGLAKVEIGMGRGKKYHDKRESIKRKDLDRESGRKIKL